MAAWANPSSLLGAGLHPTQVASSSQGHISRQQPSTPTLTPTDNFLLPISLPCVSCARKPENLKRTPRRTCRKGPGGLASHASDSANGCGACSGNQRWGQRNTRCQFAVCGQFMPVTALQCFLTPRRFLTLCVWRLFCSLSLAVILSRYFDLFTFSYSPETCTLE